MSKVQKAFDPPLYYPLYIIRKSLYRRMLKMAPLLTGKLMDFGCGSKPYKALFDHVEEYIGVDYQGEGHSHEQENIEVFYDGKTLPFPDNTFDSILANEVLEHIFNLEDILKELNRVLKPGGKILITIPFAWNEHEVPVDFGRYTSFGLTDLLNRNGFNVLEMHKTTNFIETQSQLNIVYWHKHIAPRLKPFATAFIYCYALLANSWAIMKTKILPTPNDWYLNLVVLAHKKRKHSMKITMCAYDAPGNIDGPSAWMKRLLPWLKTKGFFIRLIFFSNEHPNLLTYHFFKEKGFPCRIISWNKFDEEKVTELLQDIRDHTPDIFIPNYFPIAMEAAKIIRPSGIPVVMALHNDNAFHYALVKEYGNTCDAIVGVSAAITAMTKQLLPQHRNICTIPYGAPVPALQATPPENILKLVYAGRLVEHQKRISEVTHALCKVASQVPGTACTIYGAGPGENKVRSILAKEGKGLNVEFKGRLDSNSVQQHFAENHVFVLLSDFEGTPIAMMEAMACGLVPVGYDVESGMTELISHKENGFLVNDRDTDFVNTIRFIKDHPGEWKRMSEEARRTIVDKYSEAHCNEQWFTLLTELGNNAGLRSRAVPVKQKIKLSLPEAFRSHANPMPPKVLLPIYRLKKWIGNITRKLFE